MSKIYAGIVSYNPELKRLKENISVIQNQISAVVVFDNGSDNIDEIRNLISELTNVEFIRSEKNLGIAGALNRLMQWGNDKGYDWMLSLDQDLFDFLHDDHAIDRRSAFVRLFETLFLEQGGSVKNYWNDKGVIKANRLPYEYLENGKPTHEYQCVKEIQRGALDFIKKFGNKEITIAASILFEGVKQTGLEPKKKDIEMFADFRFFDEGETQYLAKPQSMAHYFAHRGELKKRLFAEPMENWFYEKTVQTESSV